MGRWEQERSTLCGVCHELARTGLVAGSEGNASMRLSSPEENLLLITPMGRPLANLTPPDLAVINLEGEPVEENLPPSSETALHLKVYRRRPEVKGIIHSHPLFTTVAAVAVEEGKG